jgi:hypothetical protein
MMNLIIIDRYKQLKVRRSFLNKENKSGNIFLKTYFERNISEVK